MAPQKNWPTILAYVIAAVLFIAIAGYAVMYATGYRIDFNSGVIKKTGVIAITTKPSGADVTINDRPYSRKTPFTLRNVLPGAYHIKLAKEEYRIFEKDIEVTSNQVTEEHNIDLILNDAPQTLVAEQVQALISVNGEAYYFDANHQFLKAGNPATLLKFDKLPDNVRNTLARTSGLYLASQHEHGNNWALGIISGGRRWLAIVNPDGYRGYLASRPLNQVTPENLFWINNDRLMMRIDQYLYTLDLTLNRLNLYAKGIYGATYTHGSAYYIIKNTQGKYILMRDKNLFDERPAEELTDAVPVAQEYKILITPDKDIILSTINRSVKGLWLANEATDDTGKTILQFTKIESRVGDVLYDYTNKQLLYVVGRDLWAHSFADDEAVPERKLNAFTSIPQLLGKRDESLFLKVGNKLYVTDYDASNLYELDGAGEAAVFLAPTSQHIWVLKNNQLSEWLLRENGQGLFSRWSGLWFGENYQPDETPVNTTAE